MDLLDFWSTSSSILALLTKKEINVFSVNE